MFGWVEYMFDGEMGFVSLSIKLNHLLTNFFSLFFLATTAILWGGEGREMGGGCFFFWFILSTVECRLNRGASRDRFCRTCIYNRRGP